MKLKNKGITLVALVITIIILLILAGVTIGELTESGLLDKVQLAKEESAKEQEKEKNILGDYENKILDLSKQYKDLYKSGTEYAEIAVASGGYQGTLTKDTNNLYGKMEDTSDRLTLIAWWHFKNKIDVTNISKIYFEFYDTTFNNTNTSIFANAFSNPNDAKTFSYPNDCSAVSNYTANSNEVNILLEKTLVLDVSELNGDYYIRIWMCKCSKLSWK